MTTLEISLVICTSISASDKQYNYNIEYTHIHILLSTSILSHFELN